MSDIVDVLTLHLFLSVGVTIINIVIMVYVFGTIPSAKELQARMTKLTKLIDKLLEDKEPDYDDTEEGRNSKLEAVAQDWLIATRKVDRLSTALLRPDYYDDLGQTGLALEAAKHEKADLWVEFQIAARKAGHKEDIRSLLEEICAKWEPLEDTDPPKEL